MTNTELVQKALEAASCRTLYVMGAFGAPLNAKNKARYRKNNAYNKQPARQAKIDAASADTFAFDCVGLIKGILWGWDADVNKTYGGAGYKANGVPDTNADGMRKRCTDRSTDFSKIQPGELLWVPGHVGIYIGDGLGVECTPSWRDGVQITAVANIGGKAGYNSRKWTEHGKLPCVEYPAEPIPPEPWLPQVGERVRFIGFVHYTNANAKKGKACKPGEATVRRIYRLGESKHPFNVKGIKPCSANGWVDQADLEPIE